MKKKVEERVKEYLEVSKRTTPGPWEWEYCSPGYLLGGARIPKEYGWGIPTVLDAKVSEDGNDCNVIGSKEDREFIASSREMGPKLAEALLVAIDTLRRFEICDSDYMLEKIEAIFGEKVE